MHDKQIKPVFGDKDLYQNLPPLYTEEPSVLAKAVGAASGFGLAGAGLWMIRLAVIDPEPTSKLALLVGGGIACTVGGVFSVQRILTKHKPPNLEIPGVKVEWD